MVEMVKGDGKPLMATERMEPGGMVSGIGRQDLSSQDSKDVPSSTERTVHVAVSTPARSCSVPSSPATPGRRTTPKIAGLRATFERTASNGAVQPLRSPGRLEKSRSLEQTREQDSQALRAKDEEIAFLKKKLAQETGSRQELEDECMRLREEAASVEAQLDQQEKSWRTKLEHQNGALMLERDKARDAFVEIKRQLLLLKRSISLSTRLENQVPDSSFTSEMQHLYHELQNWVVNSFRRVKMDQSPAEMLARLEHVVMSKHLEYLRPLFREWSSAVKFPMLQAVAVCYIMDVWTHPLLYGLPTWHTAVQDAAETFRAILPLPAYSKWEAVTLDMVTQNAHIKDSIETATKDLTIAICTAMTSLAGAEPSSIMVSSLNAIIRRTVSLSHVLRVQQGAKYEFILPEPGTSFDSSKMEDTSPEASSSSHAVSCATFPLVVKHNEMPQDDVPPSSVVVKAKILCCP